MSEREQILKESKDKNLTLKPLTVKMPSDAFNDITIYPSYWINQGMARCKRDVGPGNLKFAYLK